MTSLQDLISSSSVWTFPAAAAAAAAAVASGSSVTSSTVLFSTLERRRESGSWLGEGWVRGFVSLLC